MSIFTQYPQLTQGLKQGFKFYDLGDVEASSVEGIEKSEALTLIGPSKKLVRLKAFDGNAPENDPKSLEIVFAFPNLPRGPKTIDESAFFELANILGSKLATTLNWDLVAPTSLSHSSFKKYFVALAHKCILSKHKIRLTKHEIGQPFIEVFCLIAEFTRV
jgi:hypothetical protein